MELFGTTGQERRAWLDDTINNALRYYLGPTGIPERLNALNEVFNPVVAIEQSGQAFDRARNANSLSDAAINAGQGLLEVAGVAAPAAGVAYRGAGATADDIGRALTDVYAGVSGPAGQFAADESGMFAGILAKNADLDALDVAKNMANSGASRDDIWKQTGWFQGVDGKWRFEIDDSARSVNIPAAAKARDDMAFSRASTYEDAARIRSRAEKRGISLREAADSIAAETGKPIPQDAWIYAQADDLYSTEKLMQMAGSSWPIDPYAEAFRLREVMQHDDLFSAYPMAANRPLQVGQQGMAQFKAAYMPEEDSFFLQKYLDRDPDYSVGHEIQHRIQETEDFARGGNARTTVAGDLRPIDEEMDRLAGDGGWSGFDSWRNSPEGRKFPSYRAQVEEYVRRNPEDAKFARLAELQREQTALLLDGQLEYNRLAGEVEARNVQARRDMTADERRMSPPWATQDVPDDEQIVILGDIINKYGWAGAAAMLGMTAGDLQAQAQENTNALRVD